MDSDLRDLKNDSIERIVYEAWEFGKKIDLSGIGYGRVHWGNKKDVIDKPSPYYYFLSGLVKRYDLSRILEIGTHWGGATRAMWKGLRDPAVSKIVTVDITTESDSRLDAYPRIKKIVGDGNSGEVFFHVLDEFEKEPIDLVYVDAAHQSMPTFTSYAIYTMALRPKLFVFDDITLNDSMKKAWNLVQMTLPDQDTVNAADLVRAIRPSPDNPGFGIARIGDNFV